MLVKWVPGVIYTGHFFGVSAVIWDIVNLNFKASGALATDAEDGMYAAFRCRARAQHFENGVLEAYGMHCKHNC